MIPISPETQKRIEAVFPKEEWETVASILVKECGDTLPVVETSYVDLAERIRFAVLKLSEGTFDGLEKWINDAKTDWRDTLMSAEFAESIIAHRDWTPG